MNPAGALSRGRCMAESLMVDTCVVTRLTGETVTDPVTGVDTEVTIEVYSGKAKSQTYEGYEQITQTGGHTYTVQRYSVHFPVGSFVPQVGDVITWTACQHDPSLVGTSERIAGLFSKSYATAQRVFVDRGVA